MSHLDPTTAERSRRYRENKKRKWQAMQMATNQDGAVISTIWRPERQPLVLPEGYTADRISIMSDAEGNETARWTKLAKDEAAKHDTYMALLEAAKDTVTAPWISPPSGTNDDLLNVLPVGDHHTGMLSWKHETGDSYDLEISEHLLAAATDHLLARLAPARRCLIAVLGDYTHYDSMVPVTPEHHNQLDADSRAGKMIRVAARQLFYMINQAAAFHDNVHVIVEGGNHDPFGMLWMQELLRAKYAGNPRITIDASPAKFHYYRFGRNLIGTHHGDKAKMEDLPIIMAADRARDWGETTYRYIYTGHVHRRTALDVHGVSVESMRILPPADAYAAHQGYRPIRDMKGIQLHRKYGEQDRVTFNPRMLEKSL